MYIIKSFTCKLTLLATFLVLTSCQEAKEEIPMPALDLTAENLVPIPARVVPAQGSFRLDQFTRVVTRGEDKLVDVASFLVDKIGSKTGLRLEVNSEEGQDGDPIILLSQNKDQNWPNMEAYSLSLGKDSIILEIPNSEAAFRGVQTLRQLIPEISNDTLAAHPIWPVASGMIEDHPNFVYRGSMLDVARHFFSVEDVKKYIDLLAYYKINVLHLHLTDDQGWRIEIKAWPKLTEVGGSTEVGGEAGGFFTQEDYKEIVAYAAAHYMTIIPEVDMPGHTNAASVSYPFLDGTGKPLKLYEGTRVGFSTFDTRKDTTYAFIDDVVREISAITPGPYFHIGGDESHATKKSDYIYFVNRVEKIVQKYGKKMIGWDEITQADVDSSSIAQFWSNEKNATTAIEKGMKVILSPAKKAYLDMQYDTLSKHGLHWAAYIPVDTAYVWTPESHVRGIPKDQILGVEAPLWSETISNIEELEYLAFPRVIGYSELSWSLEENRDWKDFKVRLANQAPYLERMKVAYYPSPLIDWVQPKKKSREILKD
ncbi:family 20 glycosylhydrolase [Muriicola soli]|uniref:beta-N-acetylhexosaminidase n=1 Tax=Muriicola soli TaxID=2507538 RepID=A0A411EAG0_9FLAO|nr:family 20 glycosylhydrolase [Muriicola soli]QBA64638.1 beta-N-acetylhexosaminidase [Muriicola soli]